MTTCRKIFTFSWPLRGRGRGGRPKRSAWPLHRRFFFWILPLEDYQNGWIFEKVPNGLWPPPPPRKIILLILWGHIYFAIYHQYKGNFFNIIFWMDRKRPPLSMKKSIETMKHYLGVTLQQPNNWWVTFSTLERENVRKRNLNMYQLPTSDIVLLPNILEPSLA